MKQRQPPNETLQLFEEFMAQTGGNPTRDQVQGSQNKYSNLQYRKGQGQSVRRRLFAAESRG